MLQWLSHQARNWQSTSSSPSLGTKAAGWQWAYHSLSGTRRRQWQTIFEKLCQEHCRDWFRQPPGIKKLTWRHKLTKYWENYIVLISPNHVSDNHYPNGNKNEGINAKLIFLFQHSYNQDKSCMYCFMLYYSIIFNFYLVLDLPSTVVPDILKLKHRNPEAMGILTKQLHAK